ncbi:MAG: VPLPA-CTERM sorting domain-containing protein [Gammaproteobacteria bacterium]|nr:VPLPA-CTERM sorting domain-containing protein [Gammaproteobacteria bacterium]
MAIMHSMKFFKIMMMMITLALSINVSASLIDKGTYTSDTVSGLDWLDLTATTGLSYNYVSSQLGSGGLFDGWSYAGVMRIETLIQHAGGTSPFTGWTTINNGVVSSLLNTWGQTQTFLESRIITGGVYTVNGNIFVSILSDDPNQSISTTSDFISLTETTIAPGGSNSVYGSALYRATSIVPIPAAVWLFGSGLIGLMGVARRK